MLFNNKKWYSGKSSYKFIDNLIRSRSKELLICTPYIDDYYLSILKKESRKKTILLISSRYSEAKIRKAIKNTKRRNSIISGSVYSLMLLLAYAIFQVSNTTILVPALIAFLYAIFSRSFKIKVRIIRDDFVHEKLYITKNAGIEGSANLTFAGTHKNIEHIRKISEEKELKDIRKHFMEIWKSGA